MQSKVQIFITKSECLHDLSLLSFPDVFICKYTRTHTSKQQQTFFFHRHVLFLSSVLFSLLAMSATLSLIGKISPLAKWAKFNKTSLTSGIIEIFQFSVILASLFVLYYIISHILVGIQHLSPFQA